MGAGRCHLQLSMLHPYDLLGLSLIHRILQLPGIPSWTLTKYLLKATFLFNQQLTCCPYNDACWLAELQYHSVFIATALDAACSSSRKFRHSSFAVQL